MTENALRAERQIKIEEIVPEGPIAREPMERPENKARDILHRFIAQLNSTDPEILEEVEEIENLDNIDLDELANISLDDEKIEIKDEKKPFTAWRPKFTLRNHLNTVRSLDYHPKEPILLSAGDDGCVKLWNLKAAGHDKEPICTFREHIGAVNCVAFGGSTGIFYSAGVDSTVNVWNLPSLDRTPYDPYPTSYLKTSLVGHTDIVWGLAAHPHIPNLAVSSSSDGTVKLWNHLKDNSVVQSRKFDSAPTAVQFLSSDSSKIAVTTRDNQLNILDISNFAILSSVKLDDSVDSQPNCITSSPFNELVLIGHQDKCVRYVDLKSNNVVDSVLVHLDSVTDICMNSAGDNFVTCSADGSFRIWDMSFNCMQESPAHRSKLNESALCVQYHKSFDLLATGGADSLLKIFSK